MWEKATFLAHFVGLCIAQREAMVDLRARQASPSLGGGLLGGPLVDTPLPPVPTLDILAPRQPQNTPGVSNAGPNVFTTVLFPSVPTAAPTGVVVPIFVTYTGTLVPTEVPSGFQWTAPASVPGTFAPTTTPVTIPTTFNRPTTSMAIPTSRPTSMSIPSSKPTSMSIPISRPTSMSIPTSFMTSRTSLSMGKSSMTTSPTRSSTTSSTTSSASSTTSSSSITSSSKMSSTSSSAVATGTNLSKNNDKQETHALSSRSIAGIVVGLVSGAIIVIALILYLWSRNRREKSPESPGVYPQEAYLYDPPMTPPPVPGPGGNGGDIGRALSPERPGAEREGLMAGAAMAAGGAGAVAATGRGRAGSEARPPQQWNGYSPVESRDMAERNFGPTAGPSSSRAGPSTNSDDPFTDPRYELGAGAAGAVAAGTRWPLNPNADSGLGTPPGSAFGRPSTTRPSTARPSTGRPSTARSQGTRTPPTAGPSISGVGSSRYERTLSTSGPGSPGRGASGEVIPSPHMRELRKAWGMDQ